ncbi:MAG: uroporphyrinogen decarboxylase family protein [Spirochaetota bacterium]
MTGKERIARTLNREPIDRIPIGFTGIDYDTVERILGHETFWRAKIKSQIALWEGRRDEVVQSWKEDGIELHQRLDILDIVRLGGPCSGLAPPRDYEPEKVRKVDDSTWEARDGRVWRVAEASNEILLVHDPRPDAGVFAHEDPPERPDDSVFEVVDAMADALGDTRYIIGPAGREAGMVGGFTEDTLIAYVTETELMRELIDRHAEWGAMEDEWNLRPGYDGVFFGVDFSSNQGPLISPELFRDICLPSIVKRVRDVKRRGYSVVKHACGNNWKLMDMFVEAGYDAYQGIQISAGMDMARLKELYGDRLVLWGGVTVENLVSGEPDDVRADAARAVRDCTPGGGFIFGTSHTVAYGTKYDNFMAMLDAFDELATRGAEGG